MRDVHFKNEYLEEKKSIRSTVNIKESGNNGIGSRLFLQFYVRKIKTAKDTGRLKMMENR